MNRFSNERRVFYVEPPKLTASHAHLDVTFQHPGLILCVPQIPNALGPHVSDTLVGAMLLELVHRERILDPVAWVFTPAAAPLVPVLGARTVIYDRLIGIHVPDADFEAHEAQLLAMADLVFDDRDRQGPRSSSRPLASQRPTARDLPWITSSRAVTAREVPSSRRPERTITAPMSR